jgi:sporulation protein YlmC with PRC-barrel domain
MRLVELLGCRVLDARGDDIGGVHDVRFTATTVDGARTYRVHGLVIGGAGLGDRLGYRRHAMCGPWPIAPLLWRLARRSRLVEWRDVVEIDRPHIRISRRRDELESAADADDHGRNG